MRLKKICLGIVCMLVLVLTACANSKPKSTLEFVEGKKVHVQENEYIGVFFNFTNNTGKTTLPADEVDVKAFQNGKELNVVVYSGEKIEDAIQCDDSVQDGVTAKVIWTFEAQDDSTVSIECDDGQKLEFDIK